MPTPTTPDPRHVSKHTVKLIYFKPSGKYYSEGTFLTDRVLMQDIFAEARGLRDNGNLPDLVSGAGRDFFIIVNVPTHEHDHPFLIAPATANVSLDPRHEEEAYLKKEAIRIIDKAHRFGCAWPQNTCDCGIIERVAQALAKSADDALRRAASAVAMKSDESGTSHEYDRGIGDALAIINSLISPDKRE